MKDRDPACSKEQAVIGAKGSLTDWAEIDWHKVKKRIKNLRQRIYRATQEGRWAQVRSLTKLMLRSYANLLLSVRRVAQENQGRKTAGLDGQVALTVAERVALVNQMQGYAPWQVQPAKRIYIPKAGSNQPRPLGIPCITDRVAQAIVKNALEPSWEARFEANSDGFRPGRSCHDAIEQCDNRLKKGVDTWVLSADIRGAFDHISHDFILNALGNIPGRALVKQWLKAGYVEADVFYETPSGTPQGGVVSPLLANIALDGLDDLLATYHKTKEYIYTTPTGRQTIKRQKLKRYGFIRYADDIRITATSKQDIEAIVPVIKTWLKQRGLELNPEKTKITHISQGVDFLGFHIRPFKGHGDTMPHKAKVHAFVRRIRDWLKANISAKPEAVIHTLNSPLRGWGNDDKHGVSKQTFQYVDNQVYHALWQWARKRHPKKSKRWIANKYFMPKDNQRWTFYAFVKDRQGHNKTITRCKLRDIPIERHIKVAGTASPDDPALQDYWAKRQTRYGKSFWGQSAKRRIIAHNQNWRCPLCHQHLFNGEDLHTHHIIPVKDGGTDNIDNLIHRHRVCHQHFHQMQHSS